MIKPASPGSSHPRLKDLNLPPLPGHSALAMNGGGSVRGKWARGRRYSNEFKSDAVALVRRSGRPIADIAKELGVDDSTLSYWAHQANACLDDDEKAALDGQRRLRKRIKPKCGTMSAGGSLSVRRRMAKFRLGSLDPAAGVRRRCLFDRAARPRAWPAVAVSRQVPVELVSPLVEARAAGLYPEAAKRESAVDGPGLTFAGAFITALGYAIGAMLRITGVPGLEGHVSAALELTCRHAD